MIQTHTSNTAKIGTWAIPAQCHAHCSSIYDVIMGHGKTKPRTKFESSSFAHYGNVSEFPPKIWDEPKYETPSFLSKLASSSDLQLLCFLFSVELSWSSDYRNGRFCKKNVSSTIFLGLFFEGAGVLWPPNSSLHVRAIIVEMEKLEIEALDMSQLWRHYAVK